MRRRDIPLDAAIGPTWGTGRTGNYTVDASGRVMAPFGESHTFGVQALGEYMYFPGRQEGQLDAGLLYRRGMFQFGLSSSFKAASVRPEASDGALNSATLNIDVLLSTVRFGIFGSKGLKQSDVVTLSETVGPPPGQPVIKTESLLHTVDQLGGAVQFELVPNVWLDGHLEWLHRHAPGASDTAGGAARLSALLIPNVTLTMGFDVNESFMVGNTIGTFTFGVTLGRWSRPADYSNTVTPLGTFVPRLHYERFQRTR